MGIYREKIKKMVAFLMLISMLFLLTGCSNNEKSETISYKVNSEIQYIESEMVRMLSNINNISVQNYKIVSENISAPDLKTEDSESNNSSSNQGGSQDEESSQSQKSSSQNEKSKSEKSSIDILQMEQNSILNRGDQIDWKSMQYDIENLQSVWNVIILDLYKINIPSEDIVEFGNLLDTTTISIKDEDKEKTLENLTKCYQYLSKYTQQYSSDTNQINVMKTKANVLKAYSLVEKEEWEEIRKHLQEAESNFINIINNAKPENSTNINKVYITLKELENSIQFKNKDVFYIKYKNFLKQVEYV